ncbi:hypothetical protein [Chenggangzhangella methanolivorans]|uniref:Uncharacterized protein n=1 Tax=Chenggangzhangella methanolivorans TaxID=1437009 RepID=A0A9E6UHT3_9HYPH|nr:hypothetical protein [Chenggangzhangella methanolivorans]QZO00078.1 hypothetical protein K6K41_26560 [Chenggangzhangella methanolivorans]
MRAALSKALNSGTVVDGQGGAFAVRGNLEGAENFKGLVNARLIQLEPDGPNRRTLAISNALILCLRTSRCAAAAPVESIPS